HADDALRVLIVVLGGVEQLAVCRVDAMAEEMPVRLRMEPDRLPPVGRHGHAEAARPARKRHPFTRAWAKGDVMAALRKLDGAEVAAVEREQCRGIGAAIVAAGGGEQFLAACGICGLPRQSEASGAARRTDE